MLPPMTGSGEPVYSGNNFIGRVGCKGDPHHGANASAT